MRCVLLLSVTLLITAIVYWPNLHGGYVFDDYPNIVDNAPVHLTALDWASLRAALWSSPSNDLPRPLSMLSFAVDWYFGGGDPHRMKVANLCIHLANGILLFFLIRRIARFAGKQLKTTQVPENFFDILAVCVSAAWLLSPINFTAVGYIVQRMESLCHVFVFAGLWSYVSARERMLLRDAGVTLPALSLIVGTGLGLLAKESAALLPLYALIVEWCLFGFRGRNGSADKRIYALYILVLVIPALAATAWIFTHYITPAAWVNRAFTLRERLLTEPRIITDYAIWTLLPEPNSLALYHDNIILSKGLLEPPATSWSIVCLLAVTGVAVLLKASRPLVSVGILWFLSAHLITGTVIPLELAFEHRNYFASVGLYLAVFSCVIFVPNRTYLYPRMSACVGFLFVLATITWIRAMDWSNPVAFVMSEVEKNPQSPRTAYELGRTYVVASNYQSDSPMIPLAYMALEHAAVMSGADALPDQALLILAGNLKQPLPTEIWRRLQDKLSRQPLSVQNSAALYSLSQCAIKGICDFPSEEMIGCFTAALNHYPPNTTVLSIYANYAFNFLHDVSFAIELEQISITQAPHDLQLRLNLLALLAAGGRREEEIQLYRETALAVPHAIDDPRYVTLGKLLNAQDSKDRR